MIQTNRSSKSFIFVIKKLMLRILCPTSDTTVNLVRASPEYPSPNDCPSVLSASSRKTEQQDASRERNIEEDTHRNWLMRLTGRKSHSPHVWLWCDSVWFWRPENLRTVVRVSVGVSRPENQRLWCLKAGDGCSKSNRRTELALPLPSCSTYGLGGLDDAHIGGDDLLCSVCWIKHLSLLDTLTDTPRRNVLPALWASLSPAKLTHKIHHHALKIHESDHGGSFFQECHTT